MIRLIAVLLSLLIVFPVLADETVLTGTVTKVRDGDTIEVGKIPVRLQGISAPELNEPLGPRSKTFLTDLVLGKSVRCELNGKRSHDRLVGICYLDNVDISTQVIANGLALDCPKYSKGRYSRFDTEEGKQLIKLPKYCR